MVSGFPIRSGMTTKGELGLRRAGLDLGGQFHYIIYSSSGNYCSENYYLNYSYKGKIL
jgi:hypothetical protein